MDEKEFEGLTVDGAKGKIAEVMGTKDHPYFQKIHSLHKGAVERMTRLHEVAFPEPAGLSSDPDDAATGRKIREEGALTPEELEAEAEKRKEKEEYIERDPEAKAYRTETEGELKKEWGDKYEERMADAQFATHSLAQPEKDGGLGADFIDTLEADLGGGRRLGSDPKTVRLLSRLGAMAKKELAKKKEGSEEEGGEEE